MFAHSVEPARRAFVSHKVGFFVASLRPGQIQDREPSGPGIAGSALKAWPKLFQNLRATRETELAETFPLHVVCAWLGNSRPVAIKHYLQVTDEHFRKAVQNPVQQSAASARNGLQPAQGDSGEAAICGSLRGVADTCMEADTIMVGATGLEPVTSWV